MLLLLIALVVTALLWPSSNANKRATFVPPTTPLNATVAPSAATPITIASIRSYDPDDKDQGTENPDQVALAIDGNPATAWSTNCYGSQYFGGKSGVGLVIELSSPATGTLSVTMKNAPYQLDIYASNAATIPPSVESWGARVQPKSFSASPGTITAPITGDPARFVLVLLHEVGPDISCSKLRPFRGYISEISFAPAG
jgi:hypothetical protein